MLWDEPKIFFLERRYFFSIILSEFLKNRVALQQRFLVLDGDGACIAIVTIEIAVSIFLNQKTGGHNGRILGILVPSHFADGPNAAASRSFHGLIVRREESAALIVVAVFRVVAIECAAGDDNAGNRFTILHVQRQRLQA